MAGHSHSANIQFRKDRVDSKRAKHFAKLSRMLTVAARQGGGSADGNPRLRLALDKARVASMSKEAIERAIRKGTGEADTENWEEFVYEGYGPGGVAVMLEILTNNRNRTAPDVRRLLEDHGGNLAANGSVAWMFERRGIFQVEPGAGLGEDRLTEIVLDVGADDLVRAGDGFAIHCALGQFTDVRAALERRQIALRGVELAYWPKQRTVVADLALARRVVHLLEALDDCDDVQSVHSNEEFTDAVAKGLEAP
jgi:YebC/PmpR family DNA-binding regulatory protein